jgi:hypothetical protein
VVSGPVLAAECSAARPAITPGEHSKTRFSLIAARADGAIVLDTAGDTLRGFARSGDEYGQTTRPCRSAQTQRAWPLPGCGVLGGRRLDPAESRTVADRRRGGAPRWPFRLRRSACADSTFAVRRGASGGQGPGRIAATLALPAITAILFRW